MSDQDQSQEREGADGVSPNHLEGDRDAETIVGRISDAANSTTQQIGQFEILNLLGQGAFGAVYHARDPVLEREVAIKVPHASRIETAEMRQRFLREARAAAGLRHPHICPVYEVGEENDVPYIVMAFINGQELTSVLQRRGHFTDRQAALMVRRLALALEFAHQQGIVHRDLKPDNIMIDRDRREPVIMDFGLARRESGKESQLTQEGQLMGTPVYMPPEQARGDTEKIGPASDIYSLGVILYELLCSRRPHEGSMAEVLTQLLTSDPAPPSQHRADIAPELEAICMKAISRDVDDRYNSMLEFATQLANFLKSDDGTPASSAQSPSVTISEQDAPAEGRITESDARAITVIQPIPRASFDPLMRPGRRAFRIRKKIALTTAMTVIVVTGIALLASWPGKTDTKLPPGQELILLPDSGRAEVFELRTYITEAGKLDALSDRFRNHADPLFRKHGIEPLGYWVATDEPNSQNTLIYLLKHPSRETAAKSWKSFLTDPVWIRAVQETEKDSSLLVQPPDSVFLRLTDYSPGYSVNAEDKDAVFQLRTYTTHEEQLDTLDTRFKQHTIRIFERLGMQSVAYWHPVEDSASRQTLIYMLRHESRKAANESWRALATDEEWNQVVGESKRHGEILSRKPKSLYLKATDYSAIH